MNNIKILAKQIISKEMQDSIIKFFQDNPKPTDAKLHDFAEKNDFNVHDVETKIYELATYYVNFLTGGRANEKKFTEDDADPKELKMGIAVEVEHTPDKDVAKRIALDHLAEASTYYTALKEMEKKLGIVE